VLLRKTGAPISSRRLDATTNQDATGKSGETTAPGTGGWFAGLRHFKIDLGSRLIEAA
jgi:hypothetical protein